MEKERKRERERERERKKEIEKREGWKNPGVISQVSTLSLARASSWNAAGRATRKKR